MDGSCSWTGASEAGECTAFSGVLSHHEIQQKISKLGLTPALDRNTMMKYITWGENNDNWIGYDDSETWNLKQNDLADRYGFGGTMFWSVDFCKLYLALTLQGLCINNC